MCILNYVDVVLQINYMKKQIKKTLKNKHFLIGLITPLVVTGIIFYSLYTIVTKIQNRETEIYNQAYSQAYEIGRLEQLNEDAQDKDFYKNLSVNPKVAYLFEKYFPNKEEARIMRAISLAESKGKQTAINKANRNGSTDSGFFQINTIHKKKGETVEQFITRTHDLETNFQEARRILDTQGLKAWSTYNDKTYLSYIK